MRTRNDHVKQWNDLIADNKKPEPAIMGCVLGILDIVNEIKEKSEIKIEEQKSVIGTCADCGLKKKYWSKMFCANGRDHAE